MTKGIEKIYHTVQCLFYLLILFVIVKWFRVKFLFIFTGGLTYSHLLNLSQRIASSDDYQNLGLKILELPSHQIDSVWTKHRPDANQAAHELLKVWFKKQEDGTEAFHTLHAALTRWEMNQHAIELKQWVEGSVVHSPLLLTRKYSFRLDQNKVLCVLLYCT